MNWKLSSLIILSSCLVTAVPVRPQPARRGGFAMLKETSAQEDRWRTQHDEAAVALQQGRFSEAASLFLIAVQQAERFGAQDTRLAESLNGLAQVYRYQQNYAEAEPRAR